MRRLPRGKSYGAYPANTRFGDFHISHEDNLSELVAPDAFLYAGSTSATPPQSRALRRIAGYGSSPIVSYGGEGLYFLDRVREGVWRLEVYPDAVPVRDPFELPNPQKIVTRAISRAWPMTVTLPDLGTQFTVQPLQAGGALRQAAAGQFTVTPGVYLLSTGGAVDPASLPSHIGPLGLTEYHAPPGDTLPLAVLPQVPPVLVAGNEAHVRARVVDLLPPDSAKLFLRQVAGPYYRGYWMEPTGGYDYTAVVPAADLHPGPHEYVITVYRGGSVETFPERLPRQPWDWNYDGREPWTVTVVPAGAPITLFAPEQDAARLTFTRIGDAGRRGLFSVGLSPVTGGSVMHLALPVDSSGWSPPDYTASTTVVDRIQARQDGIQAARQLRLRLRGLGSHQQLHVTLMEDDGTSWTTAITVGSDWVDQEIPLSNLRSGRGVLLPQGFPGEWNYWVGPAAGRGGADDGLRVEHLERLQLSLRPEQGMRPAPGGYGVEVEWVRLEFAPPR